MFKECPSGNRLFFIFGGMLRVGDLAGGLGSETHFGNNRCLYTKFGQDSKITEVGVKKEVEPGNLFTYSLKFEPKDDILQVVREVSLNKPGNGIDINTLITSYSEKYDPVIIALMSEKYRKQVRFVDGHQLLA